MIDFTLPTDTNELLSLSSLRGKNVILYFYPKDDTTGCTMESCDFRDLFPRFVTTDAVVLGISPDGVKSHQKFKKKYKLPFTLLVDENHALAERLGIWVEKLFYGRKYMGVRRTTYIIGPDGNVRHVFEKVDPDGHALEVMAYLAGGVEAARIAREEYDARVLAAVPAASKPVTKAAGKKRAKKKPAKTTPAKKKPAKKKTATMKARTRTTAPKRRAPAKKK